MSSLKNDDPGRGRYWRSLAELEDKPEFREFLEREFAEPLETAPPSSDGRRRFLQLMGASLALAGVTSCRWKEDKLLPFSRRPDGMIPGEQRQYATCMDLGGFATGLHVTSYDGRPVKVEGNPEHPASRGACSVFHQASLLGLYDPDRSDSVLEAGKASSWEKFEAFVNGLALGDGARLRVLSEASSSPSLADMFERVQKAFPSAKLVEWEPAGSDNVALGTKLALGSPQRVLLAPEAANVIVSLDADPMAPTQGGGLAYARAIANGRDPDDFTMNRLYAVESSYTLTGAIADHRLALRAEQIKAFSAALDAAVSAVAKPEPELGSPQDKPNAAFLQDAKVAKLVEVMAKDLADNAGKSLVIAGEHQPPEVHALVARINAVLGNAGKTVFYLEQPDRPRQLDALKGLVAEMNGGQVDTLLVLGGNPVYTAPADVAFGEALAKVTHRIHASLYVDETSRECSWHLPLAHYLEAWGDGVAHDGTVSLAQPLLAPLWGGKSALEILALVVKDEQKNGLEIVRRTHADALADDKRWKKAVHDGVVAGPGSLKDAPALVPLNKIPLSERELGGAVGNGQYELVFAADPKLYDGRFANNGWLQELPATFTKQTWGNAAEVSPATAKQIGGSDGSMVRITLAGRSLEIPLVIVPGQPDGSLRLTLGYGRKVAGHVGGESESRVAVVGSNSYAIRTSESFHFGAGAEVRTLGKETRLATTVDTHSIDDLGKRGAEQRAGQIVREGTLEQYRKEPEFARHVVHHPPLLDLWRPPVSYEGHKWGMSIDMNRCIGCNACVTACQAENNIPVTGAESVARGREMLWLRVDRYFKGPAEAPEVTFQPMPCQHCENAPCEQVCPVGATVHSSEGLNDMSYNRCIGTRYCSNNCPYKVRRFNYFNYQLDVQRVTPFHGMKQDKSRVRTMVNNPEVSLRARGVMEKCTFCVQRIQRVKIQAKNVRRPIQDGEIKTACQQTCPTEAILFGDLNDSAAQVTQVSRRPRAYGVLEELNNRPRVAYLARIRNPNPELA
jgi:MoCo/4Fe-4S cofactor protein with predicted Tat translocation signal